MCTRNDATHATARCKSGSHGKRKKGSSTVTSHNLEFKTFNTSPGYYCTDVYRNNVRVFCGTAYASPDTSLIDTMRAIFEDREYVKAKHFDGLSVY